MKIAYFVCLELGRESGVLKKIRRQAAAWESLGHKVIVLYLSAEPPTFVMLENEKYWAPSKPLSGYPRKYLNRIFLLRKVKLYLRTLEYDVLYARQVMWFPGINGLFRTKTTVVECNTNDVVDINAKPMVIRSVLLLLRNLFFANVCGVVSVTKELSSSFRKSIRFASITNSISVPRELVSKAGARDTSVFFMSTPNQPWQGVDKIILLARFMPEVTWIIAGWERNSFKEQIPSNVQIVGYISQEKISQYLKECGYALGPLALHRKNMNSTSAIKVGEYLVSNLPTILAYEETGVAGDFLCQLENTENNITEASVKAIRGFISYWESRDINANDIKLQIDSLVVENRRVSFLRELL